MTEMQKRTVESIDATTDNILELNKLAEMFRGIGDEERSEICSTVCQMLQDAICEMYNSMVLENSDPYGSLLHMKKALTLTYEADKIMAKI